MATLKTLASFEGTNGSHLDGPLIFDASGNLYGTTREGGANNQGTVFKITNRFFFGYSSTPTTLVSFNATNGAAPVGGLIADSAGNLYGTTRGGGTAGFGTVFEIAKTTSGYASTPTTLVTFGGAYGAAPTGTLIADAAGNLYGTTSGLGASGNGTVFEIAKTATGYAASPTSSSLSATQRAAGWSPMPLAISSA